VNEIEALEKQALSHLGLSHLGLSHLFLDSEGQFVANAKVTKYYVSNYWTARTDAFFGYGALIVVVKAQSGEVYATVEVNNYGKSEITPSAIEKYFSSATCVFPADWADPFIQYLTTNQLFQLYYSNDFSMVFDGIECSVKLEMTDISVSLKINLDAVLNLEVLKIRAAFYQLVK
jgi:hypothetical protein